MTKPENWTQHLLPDALTGRRMRRTISEATAELLVQRRDDWWEVASRWAGILAPVGIAATLAFAAIAVADSSGTDEGVALGTGTEDVFEALSTETAPVGFADAAPDDAAVVFAAIGAADRQRNAVDSTRSTGP